MIPFPSLQKKMKDYIKEYQAIANPFANGWYPSRTQPSPFAKRPKGTPVKRSNLVTRCHIEKLSKPRKVNVGYHPGFLQQNWLADKAKEVEAVTQASNFLKPAATLAISTQQVVVSVTFTQPSTTSAASAMSVETSPDQSQNSPGYCAIYTPSGK